MDTLVGSFVLWVSDLVRDLVVGAGVISLDKGLETQISVLVVAAEWLMVEFVVLRAAMVAMNDRIAVLSVVTLSNAVILWFIVDGPGVH